MAEKAFAVNDALANKLWSKELAKETLKKTYFGRFMGKSEDSMIQLKSETGKAAGDKVTCGLVMQLTGDGQTEGGTLEGNEEDLTTYDDSIFINELRHAVRVRNKGTIDQQRVPYNLRNVARNRMADWNAHRMDTTMFLHLCGYTGASFTRQGQTVDKDLAVYNGNNTITAPTSTRHVWADGNSDDQSLTSSTDDKFDLTLIDEAKLKAVTASPLIRPIKYNGDDYYCLFMHPSQVKDMRTSTSTGQWLDITKAAYEGKADGNPIFTGALGIYNKVILHESYYIPNGVNSSTSAVVANTKRAVMCGAQSGMVAYGQAFNGGSTRYNWVEELFDYQHSLGVSTNVVWGIKKCVFNSKDFGTIVVSTYGVDNSE